MLANDSVSNATTDRTGGLRIFKIVCLAVILGAVVLATYWGMALWGQLNDEYDRAARQRLFDGQRHGNAMTNLPRSVEMVEKFLTHLRNDDLTQAYALTSSDFRETNSLDQFRVLLDGRAAILKKRPRFLAQNRPLDIQPGQQGQHLGYGAEDDNGILVRFAIIVVKDDDGARIQGWHFMDR